MRGRLLTSSEITGENQAIAVKGAFQTLGTACADRLWNSSLNIQRVLIYLLCSDRGIGIPPKKSLAHPAILPSLLPDNHPITLPLILSPP